MAVYLLDPNADSKADQTEVPPGTAFSCIDDAVRQPTTPNLTDYVESSTAGQATRVDLTTVTLAGGETVAGVRVWAYVEVPATRGMRVLVGAPAGTATLLRDDSTINVTGWVSFTIVAPLTQTQVNDLQLQVEPLAGTGVCRVYAAYVELHTSTEIWAAANAVLLANRDPNTGLSIAAGFLGGDCFTGVPLGGGVTALMMRDSYKATAAGQQQTFGTNPHSAAAARTAFIRSGIGILSADNPEAATFTLHSGAGNSSYFPDVSFAGQTCVRWPQRAFIRSGRLFVVGMLETSNITPIGRWVAYCDDWASNPTNPTLWTWTYPAMYGPGVTEAAVGDQGIWDNTGGDGNVYLFDSGVLLTTRGAPSIYRIPAAQFQPATNWRGGEWWTGTGWSKDKRGVITTFPPGVIGRRRPRGATYSVELGAQEGAEEGSVHRRGDGKFQITNVFDAPWLWNPLVQLGTRPYHMSYALTSGAAIGKFGALVDKYTIPDVEDWVYQGGAFDWLTWPGKGADDQVWSYNGNSNRGNNFESAYYPKWVKAVAVT